MKINTVIKTACALLLTGLLLAGCASNSSGLDSSGHAKSLGDFEPRVLDNMMVNTLEVNSRNLKSRSMKVVFFPAQNGVRFELRFFTNSVHLDLTEENRTVLVKAMTEYIEQYKAGKLDAKNEKRKALFGKTQVAFMWGLVGPSYSTTIPLRFEYLLIEENRPYFLMANASTTEQTSSGATISDGVNSPALRIALSPIQCAALIELISQENLVSIVNAFNEQAEAFDLEDF